MQAETSVTGAHARGEEGFLLGISDRLRRIDDPLEILGEAAAAVGAYLGASRAGYAEVDPDGIFTIERDWTDGSVKPGAGRRTIAAFGAAATEMLYRGETQCIEDARTDPRVGAGRPAFEEMRIEAAVTVPLLKDGRLVAMFSVQKSEPRAWRDAEVRLIEEVAERTWGAHERAKTAARLRDSEATLAFLLELGDRTRHETDAAVILRDAVEAIGRRLRANRVGYAEINAGTDILAVDVEWGDGTLRPITGHYPLTAFGTLHVGALARGETACIADVGHSRHIDDTNRSAIDAMGIRAAITVPLVRHGELVALLSVHHGAPRGWTDGEVRLVEEVAERTWAVVERARAEAELRQSQALLAAFMENAPVGMYLKDETGRYIMANAGMDRIFGRPAAGVVGRHIDELFDAPARERIAAQEAVAFAEGRAQTAEQHLPGTEDGSWTLVIRFPIELGAQQRRIGGFAIDVTEQKRAEARLAESEARLMAFLTHAPASMYLKDSDGRYLIANAEVARRLGVPQDAVPGRTIAELASPEIAAYTEARERAVLASGQAETYEQAFELPEGMVHALATRFPVPDADGQLTRIGGVLIDVTPQKRAEAELARSREALHQSEKLTALGSLLAGVSHELNNPLSVVVAQAVMLEEDTEGGPLATRASKIRTAAERCAKIVQTFLAMARQKSPQRRWVDMNAVVAGALELTGYGLRSSGVEVRCDFADALPPVIGDADQLHQVIANLVVNAQHALEDVSGARELRIATRAGHAPGTVEVELVDNGPGVPPEHRRRLFEPFFTTKPQGAGTGLGLSFSLGVAEAHGGTLELVGKGPGAAFRLTLPANGVPARREAPAAAMLSATHGDALVVDDEADIAEIIAELLGKQGYRVEIARNGSEAKTRLAARDFDLVLSDLRMPDVDGPALHAWLAANKPHLLDRLGFVTGDTMGPNAVRFLGASGRPTLEKPFTPQSLRAFVARVRPGVPT
jgi:PAS domain S-box-containing protein